MLSRLAVFATSFLSAEAATTELKLKDGARNNRKVKVLLYYPDDLPAGPVPLIVMAHCLMGGGNWYEYLGDALIQQGYAMASIQTHQYMPSTSNSLAPDQAFVLDELRRQSKEEADFPLFGKLEGGKAAASGHSLGGAASYYSVNKGSKPLKGHYSADFDTILTMSACCGWPDSPIGVKAGACDGEAAPHDALNVTRIPSLQLTGTKDCLCPPSNVAEPFYNELASECKYLVEITGATHCHFDAIPGALGPVSDKVCVGLEKTMCVISPNPDEVIPIATQEAKVIEHALAWFDWTLKGNMESLAVFDAKVRSDAAAGNSTLKAKTDGCPAPSIFTA